MPKSTKSPQAKSKRTTFGFRPNLWFDGNAQEAARFYCKVFPRSKVTAVRRAPSDYPGGGQEGQVLTVEWELDGQPFVGINGGPQFHFSEAISFEVHCKDQREADKYTDALSAVPESEQCGWVKDRYGLSWQIVPRAFYALMNDPDPAVPKAVFEAMMPMKRLDIAALEAVAAKARGRAKRPTAAKTTGAARKGAVLKRPARKARRKAKAVGRTGRKT